MYVVSPVTFLSQILRTNFGVFKLMQKVNLFKTIIYKCKIQIQVLLNISAVLRTLTTETSLNYKLFAHEFKFNVFRSYLKQAWFLAYPVLFAEFNSILIHSLQ